MRVFVSDISLWKLWTSEVLVAFASEYWMLDFISRIFKKKETVRSYSTKTKRKKLSRFLKIKIPGLCLLTEKKPRFQCK